MRFSPRTRLPAVLLIGLISGCAHSGGTGQGETEEPTPQSPSRWTVTAEDIERRPGEPIEGARGANGVIVIKTKRPDLR
ncbi:MAG: hypothetical protein HYW06_10530 [Gemmatimonadetes bacterium]|nr:hypothetical protein [Gemmatimonadota bacterium]MBI2537374.1 hypothetical protein [Gemmatimonadota bacterium]